MESFYLDSAMHMATHCGNCGRNFDDCGGDYVTIRLRPARLICEDCRLKEKSSVNEKGNEK